MPDKKDPKQLAIEAYKNSVRQAESGGSRTAKAPTSSATGLYQFTEATWKEMEKKLGKKLDIFSERDQELAMNKLTDLNVSALEKNNIPVTPSNLYMTHFLGLSGGPKFLKNLEKNPNELASKYVSAGAVKSNANLFYNNDKPVTAAELYNKMSSKVGGEVIAPEQTQPDFIPLRETNPSVIESTGVPLPRINRDLKPNQTAPRQVSDNTSLNNSPVEGIRNTLGLSGDLDFLPKDINLAFTEEEQLNNELSNPDELVNIARNGGKQVNYYDNGGMQLTNAEPSRGLLETFNEGGTHEENKYGGIPQGVGNNGKLNTVEEGESKYNNYVFSDTLIVNDDDIESLFLPKQIANKTFADASKYINSILEDNPNDMIIRKTVQKQLDSLTLGNEKARLAKEELDINLGKNNLFTEVTENTNEMFLGGFEGGSNFDPTMILGKVGQGANLIDQVQGNTSTSAINAGLQGAASGASVGSILGPLGSGIGGIVGLGAGLIGSGKAKDRAREQNKINHTIASSTYQNDFAIGGDLTDNYNVPTKDEWDSYTPFSLEDPYLYDNLNFRTNADLSPTGEPDLGSYTPQVNNYIPDTGYPSDFTTNDFPATNNVNNSTSATQSNYNPKGKNFLQYAPVLGDFLNLREANRDRAEVENLNSISSRFIPDYADEASVQNMVNNTFDNTVNALSGATNGSQGALRANILGAGLNRNRALSDAYFKIDEINRNQNLQGQQFNLGIDQFNIGQDNQERDINARNRAAVEDRRRAARDTLFRDLGAIGREQTYDNRLYNLTGGYDSMGSYDPNRLSFLEQLGLTNNEKKSGGILSTAYSTMNKRTNHEEEFNKRYK